MKSAMLDEATLADRSSGVLSRDNHMRGYKEDYDGNGPKREGAADDRLK